MKNKEGKPGRLSPGMALGLAAPQTWTAALIPALLGAALARDGAMAEPWLLLSTAAACVLMQSAANVFNDYCDFIKGGDTLENSPDAEEAVLLYRRPEPRKVLYLGFALLLLAAAAGVPAILRAGWPVLAVGAVGAAALLAYSFGKKPLSYLPLGELTSAFVMGGLIPLGVSGSLGGGFSPAVLLKALPVMLGVGLIMLTNNLWDIQKDRASGRKTFTVLLGEAKSLRLYRLALLLWFALPLVVLPVKAWAVYLPGLLASGSAAAAQLRMRPGAGTRLRAMAGINSLNAMLGCAYIIAVLFS